MSPSLRIPFLLALCILMAALALPAPAAQVAHHELAVRLDLAGQTLAAEDRVTVTGGGPLIVSLSLRLELTRVEVGGRAVTPERRGGSLHLPAVAGATDVLLAYSGRFDDPLPEAPPSFDNPGVGGEALITAAGAFFLPGSLWYPWLEGADNAYTLRISTPPGTWAVCPGRPVSRSTEAGANLSVWQAKAVPDGLYLFAGPYTVGEQTNGPTQVLTYFFPETAPLSPRYLAASAKHLAFYSRLHGPYAYPSFAVVENFLPTGYGFPGATLLGSQVLALPFIPETSLRHEVAHDWWGNGVLVGAGGNWCEGLTTYVADYLAKEEESPAAARQYRRELLADYASLAAGEDLALSAFVSRTDPANRAVGYGKAAMVYHMIRRTVGETAFWQALRDVYAARLFQETGWEDFRRAFAAAGTWPEGDSRRFMAQWVEAPGAPTLRVFGVRARPAEGGWRVSGRLSQSGSAPYLLDVPLVVTLPSSSSTSSVRLTGVSRDFVLSVPERPERLEVDPEFEIFRRLDPAEVPAAVNGLKGANALLAVLADDCPAWAESGLRRLLAGLNQEGAEIIHEKDVKEADAGRDVLFWGWPETPAGQALLPPADLAAKKFAGNADCASGDTLLLIAADPARPGRVAGVLAIKPCAGQDAVLAAVTKITHYGRYGRLVFAAGRNLEKTIPEPVGSPLSVNLKDQP